MGFFDVPPEPHEPEKPKRPPREPWSSPPHSMLGGTVSSDILLAKAAKVAVVVRHITAYPDGFEADRAELLWDGPESATTAATRSRRRRQKRRRSKTIRDGSAVEPAGGVT